MDFSKIRYNKPASEKLLSGKTVRDCLDVNIRLDDFSFSELDGKTVLTFKTMRDELIQTTSQNLIKIFNKPYAKFLRDYAKTFVVRFSEETSNNGRKFFNAQLSSEFSTLKELEGKKIVIETAKPLNVDGVKFVIVETVNHEFDFFTSARSVVDGLCNEEVQNCLEKETIEATVRSTTTKSGNVAWYLE